MLHKFVAASQAQSRSWKTYMKKDLPSPVAFFGANLLLFAIPSVLHAASPRGFQAREPWKPHPGGISSNWQSRLGQKPFFPGRDRAQPSSSCAWRSLY